MHSIYKLLEKPKETDYEWKLDNPPNTEHVECAKAFIIKRKETNKSKINNIMFRVVLAIHAA